MVGVFCIRSQIRSLKNMKSNLHVFGFLSYINFPAHLEKKYLVSFINSVDGETEDKLSNQHS